MWLHHDLGWWGFVLAIVTLILAYPLDVLAHLTTPVLKNWWAERSVASLTKRINKLEKELAEVEATPISSAFEHKMLLGIARVGWLVRSVGGLVMWLFILCTVWLEAEGHLIPHPIFLLMFMVVVTKELMHLAMARSLSETASGGTEKGREEMRASITKLRAKLPAQ